MFADGGLSRAYSIHAEAVTQESLVWAVPHHLLAAVPLESRGRTGVVIASVVSRRRLAVSWIASRTPAVPRDE
jgi:hypothetical protein